MSIVLPIVFFAVGMGLFVRRMTPRLWAVLVVWIILVIGFNYIKPQTASSPIGASGATGDRSDTRGQ